MLAMNADGNTPRNHALAQDAGPGRDLAETLERLRGNIAVGHTRYSTAGDSAILNAQPIMVDCNKGMLALAHNGNLVNAHEIRSRLEAQGSIFQTTSRCIFFLT